MLASATNGILVNSDTIIKAGAVVSALIVIIGLIVKYVNIHNEKERRVERIELRVEKLEHDVKVGRVEKGLLMEGILACLDGLEQQGCNHTVTATKQKIEKYLNERVHS